MSLEGPSRHSSSENHEPIFDSRETQHAIFSADDTPHLHDELREKNAGEHHVSNLFDENESRLGGERLDLATGKRIDTSTSDPLDGLEVHDATTLAVDDAAGDAADKWLRENDPNYKKLN